LLTGFDALMTLSIRAQIERWPIAGTFVISRGSRAEATVVVAEVSDGIHTGRGEGVPYLRYGETPESVLAAIEAQNIAGSDRWELRRRMPARAARNALDCALWDYESKKSGLPAWRRAGLVLPKPITTAYTISLGDPATMAEAARKAANLPVLKIKLGGDGDPERILAVHEAVPHARLIADANEAWSERNFLANMRACVTLPADADELLREVPHTVPICADESVHVRADLDRIAGKYDAVNVKLDKAGGLTEALELLREAKRRGYIVMAGCMVGTSLAMAPALLLAQEADYADLDGPLLLARDRTPGLVYSGATVEPPHADLWG
jgi:L-alanine-DL-glutamate epimerase-like enolase superfamily enzyme